MAKLNLKKPKSFEKKVEAVLAEAAAEKAMSEKEKKFAKAYGMSEMKIDTTAYKELLLKVQKVFDPTSEIAAKIAQILIALEMGQTGAAVALALEHKLKLNDLHDIAAMYKIEGVPTLATEEQIAAAFKSAPWPSPNAKLSLSMEPTNEDRVGMVDELVREFAKKSGLGCGIDEDGPTTVAGDMICNILHWVAAQPWMDQDPRKAALFAMRNGIGHYIAESYITDAEAGDIGPEVHVTMIATAEEERWFVDTQEGASIVQNHEEDDPEGEEE